MPDQGGEGLFSPYLRRKRIAKARNFLHGRVLDVGCGSGSLAAFVPPDCYFGVDPDDFSLSLARTSFPRHSFSNTLPGDKDYDVIAALAVIEHVPDPSAWLTVLTDKLAAGGTVVLTTPHPTMEWIHTLGARLGIFSSHAKEQHDTLIDASAMSDIGNKANLYVKQYFRFLWGCNQLFILSRSPSGA